MTTLARPTENPINEFFEWLDLNRPTRWSDLTHYIPVESYTKDGRYVVRADLPGIDPVKDIEVKVEGNVLTIHGERREEDRADGHSELRYGSFTRSVRLPKGASPEDVTAHYTAGVLEVSVPVKETPTEAIKIAVTHEESTTS